MTSPRVSRDGTLAGSQTSHRLASALAGLSIPVAVVLLVPPALADQLGPPPPALVPPMQLAITPARPVLVLGAEEHMMVTVTVDGPGPETVPPPRVIANVGTIEPVVRLGPRAFQARYVAPLERFPQIAMIAAELEYGKRWARGLATVRMPATTSIPFRTDPGAAVTLRVADKDYGPLEADREGKVRIPVVVPPGVSTGLARSVNVHGNTTETKVDLQLPSFNRVFIVTPPSLEVGTSVEVAVFAIDLGGAPARTSTVTLRSSAAPPQALGGPPGQARFAVPVPEKLVHESLRLRAIVPGAPGKAGSPATADVQGEVSVALRASRPRRLILTPSQKRLTVGSGASSRVTVSAEDQHGNPAAIEGLEMLLDGQAAKPERGFAGQMTIDVPAPIVYEGRDRVRLEAFLDLAYATEDIRLGGGAPTALDIKVSPERVTGDGRTPAEVRVKIVDRLGTPTNAPWMTWRTTGGNLGEVATPSEGLYVTSLVPRLAVETTRASVEVELTRGEADPLRAAASIDVDVPFRRVAITARVGAFTNLGQMSGPTAFIEVAGRPSRLRWPVRGSLSAGYLRSELTAGDRAMPTRLELQQVPLLAGVRYHFRATSATEVSLGGSVGISFATTTLVTAGITTRGSDTTFAAAASAEAAVALGYGQLVFGARYLWIDFGRTSAADVISGNTAGLLGDVGYRFGF